MRARNGAGFGPWSNGMTFTVNLSGGTLPTLAPKWPILGGTHDQLGQTYGEYGAVTAGEFHSGIDIVADIGTVVVAAAAGRVIRFDMGSGNFSSPQDKDNHCMGNVVIIDHSASGRTGPFTLYAHLSQIDVQNGATPSAGDRSASA